MNKHLAVFFGALLALILSACGGGGGGGVAAPPGPPPTGTINNASALTVAGRSLNAALQSGSFGDVTSFAGLNPVSTGGTSKLGSATVTKTAGWRVVGSQVPVGPDTTPCDVDGSVTVSGDIASPLTITPGDFLDFSWDTCDNGLGQIIDGLIGMTFTDFEGDLLTGQSLLGVSLDIGNFQVTQGANVDSADGDLSLTVDSRTPLETVVTTSGNSFVVSNNNGTETLSNFSSVVTESTNVFPSNFTTEASGTISSTQFDGFVNYDTPVPFQSVGDGYPHTGEMQVSGANNSIIRLIAQDDMNVRIEADYNGDNVPDATIDTTWDALING